MMVDIPCGVQFIVFWTNLWLVISLLYLVATIDFAIAPKPDGTCDASYLRTFSAKEFDLEEEYRNWYNGDGETWEGDDLTVEEWEPEEYVDEWADYEPEDDEDEDVEDPNNPDNHDWDQYVLFYDWDAAFGDSDIRYAVYCAKDQAKSARYYRPHNMVSTLNWYDVMDA